MYWSPSMYEMLSIPYAGEMYSWSCTGEERRGAEGKHYLRQMYMGVPQGSVIGPLLWLLNYDGLLLVPLPPGCCITGFADDVGFTIVAATLEELTRLVRECTGVINRWLTDHGLELALQKSEWTFLNRKRVPRDLELSLGDVSLGPSELVRYLGVFFESRRNFRQHIEQTTNRAIKTVGSLSRVLANFYGPRMFVRRAYYAVIESVVLYAASIWEKEIEDAKNAAALRRIQRIDLSRVCCAYRSVSLAALCVLGRAPPLDLKVRERARVYELNH